MPPTLTGRWPQEMGRPPDLSRPQGDYTEGTVHGTRIRGWKRSSIAAAVVFLVAMSGITGAELLSGHDLDGGIGTTVGSIVHGGSAERPTPSSTPSGTTTNQQQAPNGDRNDGGNRAPAPSGGSGGDGQATPDPGRSGSTTGPVPSPAQSSPGTTAPGGSPAPSGGDGAGDTGPDNGTASPAG